jgi:3-mercaptopyruvate sulfurtransferase SseA
MRTHLKELGIGKDNAILCYDNDKGVLACHVAILLSTVGLTEVLVLNGKYQSWNELSAQPRISPIKANGTVFDYSPKVDYYATLESVSKIEEGKSVTVLIDCREDKKEFALRHRKNALHISWRSLMENHVRKEPSDIL